MFIDFHTLFVFLFNNNAVFLQLPLEALNRRGYSFMSGFKENNVTDFDVVEKTRQELQPPSQYKVILHNDDYTPMDFVIDVLSRFFNMQYEKASEIMLKVHYEGKAICGVFSAEIAETKVYQVLEYAKEHEHPLLCTMERA